MKSNKNNFHHLSKIALWISIILIHLLLGLIANPKIPKNQKSMKLKTADYPVKAEVVIDNLRHPWGLTWAGDVMLVSERNGYVYAISKGVAYPLVGLPTDIAIGGQGGWMDLLQVGKYTYLSYAKKVFQKRTTALVRFKLDFKNNQFQVKELTPIFQMLPERNTSHHYGGKLTTDNQYIYLSLGDRGSRYEAQNENNHIGGIIRLHLDGSIPKDNQFNAKELFSIGHRNVQGLFYDSKRKALFATEHGPKGGDELNLVKNGNNYGWPTVSYGKEYGSNTPVSKITTKPGITNPIKYWAISPALSGLAVYRGDEFPKWNGDLLLGALKFQRLYRISLDKNLKMKSEEQMFANKLGRIRAIRIHPKNGTIYLLTDHQNGSVVKISRQK